MTIAIIIGIILILFYLIGNRKQKKQKINSKPSGTNQEKNIGFQSNLSAIKFPDRINAIDWHYQKIQQGLNSGNTELTNLSYAKLYESIRQQNANEGGNYDDILNVIAKEYADFRDYFQVEYPEQFLPPKQRKRNNPSKSKMRKLIQSLNNNSHPEYPLLRKEYDTISRMPVKDFTPWIIEQLKEDDFDSLFWFISEFYLGQDKSREKELRKKLKEYLSKDYSKLLNVDEQAIYEIQAFFILQGGIDDFNREFWISNEKQSELLCKILSVYSFKININEFKPLITKANKFLKEMRKETDYWEDYDNYDIKELHENYKLNTNTDLANKLKTISSGQRLYFFDFTSIYTYRRYWNGDSSYKTRSYGIYEPSDFEEILNSGLFDKAGQISSLSEIASKSELKSKAENQGLEIKKSWTLKKIIENLSKTKEGTEFLKDYLRKQNIVEFKDEFKDDLQDIFQHQKNIKPIVDLIIMK